MFRRPMEESFACYVLAEARSTLSHESYQGAPAPPARYRALGARREAASSAAAGASGRPSRSACLAASPSATEPPATPSAPSIQIASGTLRRGRLRAGVRLRAERDHVRQLAHRLQVAERRQPREAERIEVVARKQPQAGVGRIEQPSGAVVDEIALQDALDQQRVVRGALTASLRTPPPAARTTPPPARRRARRRARRPRRATSSRSCSSASSLGHAGAHGRPPRTPRQRQQRRLDLVRRRARATGTRPRTARRQVDAALQHRAVKAREGIAGQPPGRPS